MKLPFASAALLSAAVACASSAHAQSSEWEHTLLFYLFDAGVDGESQIGSTVSEVDESFSNILEHLDMGGMGSFRATKQPWAHTIDAIYSNSSDDVALPSDVRVKAEVDQLIASYDIGYQLSDRFEVLVGARFNSIDLELTEYGPTQRVASGSQDWIDPYIGLNSVLPFNEHLALALRGDVGGFDIGSKLAWQAIVRLNWSFSETFYATFGYRILDTDYEDGAGESFFKYDVTMSGPGAGFGWRF
jgi:hypothetical protein